MSKKVISKSGSGSTEKVIKKEAVISEDKRIQSIKIIKAIIDGNNFPMVAPNFASLAANFSLPEKTIKLAISRLEKVCKSLATKKEKKSKNLEAELEAKVKDCTVIMAQALANRQFKTNATFERILVTKKSNKQNKNACGKTLFTLGNGKSVYMYWEYRDGNIFAGSVLHDTTKE